MDFIPKGEPDLLVFLDNFEVKVTPYATAAGVPAAEVAALIARITPYRTASQTLENDRATMQERTLTRATDREAIVADIRAMAGRIKAAPNGDAAAKDLQVKGSAEDAAARADNTPVATVTTSPQGPVIKFTNPTREGVNVYRRVVGVDARATFLARDTRSPYIDTEDFATPVKVEYYVVPVKNDAETGEPSATVTITTGG